MTPEQKEHILRGLPKNSPVKYIGHDVPTRDGKGYSLQSKTTGYKVRNVSRPRAGDVMAVMIAGGTRWYLPYRDLTCKAIEVFERLEGTTKKP